MGLAGFVLEEVIAPLVKGALEDYTKDMLKGIIGEAVIAAKPSVMGEAVRKSLREFLEIIQDELENCAYSPLEIRDYYQVPIGQFIKDEQVRTLLGKPFEEKAIDSRMLEEIWKQRELRKMPDDFSWEYVAGLYGRKVKAIIRTTPELRAVIDSENIERTRQSAEEIERTLQQREVNPGFDLEKYRESIKECYGYLKLNVLDSTDQQYRLRLWKMFIPQLVREALPPSRYELPKGNQQEFEATKSGEIDHLSNYIKQNYQKYLQQPLYSVLQLLADEKYRFVVVLGDPGSGKSTLLQWLALQWAEEPTEQLPLVIELREYTRDRVNPANFLEFFHRGTRTIYKLNQLELDRKLRSGTALVMFDALDEVVNPDDRQAIIREIINFSNEYDKIKIIITSRIVGYNAEHLREAGFRHLTLQELSQSQIWKFIDKWYELALGNDPEREKLVVRLKDAIENSSAIEELAKNPLLLTMMAILNRRQELPRDRTELYDQASRVLLYIRLPRKTSNAKADRLRNAIWRQQHPGKSDY
jgi:energy-coupling factor transporter ATP-binding protein EcfA2